MVIWNPINLQKIIVEQCRAMTFRTFHMIDYTSVNERFLFHRTLNHIKSILCHQNGLSHKYASTIKELKVAFIGMKGPIQQ